jgi:hypothetical protein
MMSFDVRPRISRKRSMDSFSRSPTFFGFCLTVDVSVLSDMLFSFFHDVYVGGSRSCVTATFFQMFMWETAAKKKTASSREGTGGFKAVTIRQPT